MQVIAHGGEYADPASDPVRYVEQLRNADLSVGTYSLRAGAFDDQRPHTEDEVYVVMSGRARFTAGRESVDVRSGSVLYVPAREEHRFHDIEADLAVLVLFAPPYGTRTAATNGS